jgi:hypothetical protein
MGVLMSPAVDQEAPAPAAELAGLAFFAGSWQAEGTFHATPVSAQKPIRMSIDADVVHRGFWLQTRTAEHPSAKNPNPVTVTCLWGYDTETGRFSAEWFDSNGGLVMHLGQPGLAQGLNGGVCNHRGLLGAVDLVAVGDVQPPVPGQAPSRASTGDRAQVTCGEGGGYRENPGPPQ